MSWFGDNMWGTWLVIATVLVVLEVASTDLILIMLAAGAVVGLVVDLLGGPVPLQITLACVVAVGLLAFLRPEIVKRLHAGPTLHVGPAALIGRSAFVLEPMTHMAPGRVKIGGDVWTAQPFDAGDHILEGEAVEVVTIKGATAYVVRAPEPKSSTTS
ncbi:MAG TPA: NfeD family protein [Marmoricola sp.]|jgi:membrane protein implicated in regulation of membrane protease activity|nr:NfeD family protein [Marmoricola sp.]